MVLITYLEPLSTAIFQVGELSSLDLFDQQGILLLSKGKPITANILELLRKRKLYTLKYKLNKSQGCNKTYKFDESEYQDIVGNVREVFEDMCLFSVDHLYKTLSAVDKIIHELEGADQVYIDLNKFRQFDDDTYIHSVNVAILATLIGMQIGFAGQTLRDLTLGALLHDIGKGSIPPEILNKPSELTSKELEIIKKHPLIGEEMLKEADLSAEVLSIIRHHHERWNGHGYPDGVSQQAITLSAQVVAVSDVFDALISDRPYRKGLPPYYALELIIAGSGEEFNENIVKSFLQCLVLYPEGSIVTLNTGEVGTVIKVQKNYPSRPIIKILFDKYGNFLDSDRICDLSKDLTKFIASIDFKYVP
ncbi:HD-GYP domain-containing protein [Desulfosporosinus hippei]|uniref:HD-GYP domain-containing protein n=1 Tax=Desulfosporosinus hippei TaxID=569859 RepID=UPI000A980346|nr:HD-GYP domain-containing protein [Desulfosporosinus hippei]